jgi:hypothetical protein
MTYCVGMVLDEGIVMASDSRTNAGVDNFATFCKMTVFERRGDRVLILVHRRRDRLKHLAGPRRPSPRHASSEYSRYSCVGVPSEERR